MKKLLLCSLAVLCSAQVAFATVKPSFHTYHASIAEALNVSKLSLPKDVTSVLAIINYDPSLSLNAYHSVNATCDASLGNVPGRDATITVGNALTDYVCLQPGAGGNWFWTGGLSFSPPYIEIISVYSANPANPQVSVFP